MAEADIFNVYRNGKLFFGVHMSGPNKGEVVYPNSSDMIYYDKLPNGKFIFSI
jgi:hypothetical protein